jgi:geranylgeranyl reductase family protein
MFRADVAVVGAGPAGTSAALALANAGARVTLFDASHPREKPCGGGLTARAQTLISDVVRTVDLDAVMITSIRFESADRRTVRVALPPTSGASGHPPLVVVNRATFDAALLEAAAAAGVTVVQEQVLDVRFDDDAARLRTAARVHDAGFVIGADGVTSLVRRRVGTPFDRTQLSSAVGFYQPGEMGQEAVIRFMAHPPGYMWAFPRRDRLAAGCGVRAGDAPARTLRADVARWLDELCPESKVERHPYAWPIPSLTAAAIDRERPAGDRWLLVGDAAGLVDPLTREGIYFALRSGQLAAAAIAQATSTTAPAYLAALRREIYPELRRAALLSAGFFSAGFIDLLVRALEQSDRIEAVMVDLISGRQAYRSLRTRLLQTAELRLAWQVVRMRAGRRP